MNQTDLICIGASAGGVAAIQTLMSGLVAPPKCPIVITQHLPFDSDWDLKLIFGRFLKGEIHEACDKMPLHTGKFYFAPPGYHLLVERGGTLALSQDDFVHFARPSIDVLFDSAACAYGDHACGILLTGANADGAEGLAGIGHAGGMTIVQDPEEAEMATMPQMAIAQAHPQKILRLKEIARWINECVGVGA